MRVDLSKALDQCLLGMRSGMVPEACLANYQHLRQQLEPLLNMAAVIGAAPKVGPADEFRNESWARLITKARGSAAQMKERSSHNMSLWGNMRKAVGRFGDMLTPSQRVFAPLMSMLFLAIAVSLVAYSIPALFTPASALESQCTLSVLSGVVEVQEKGSDVWQSAEDGSVLAAGSRVRTDPDARGLLTFFEGTTIKIESDTDIEILRVTGGEEQPTEIVLKQWVGKTWSRVVKKIDPGSRYEIKTPSAYALVRGTMFETEVDENGTTAVRTIEGTVSVGAQNEEVSVTAGLEASVESGAAPSQPVAIQPAKTELVIRVSMPAVASVSDPASSSTGYLPSGISFNQISGSYSSSPIQGDQIISIPEPVSGIYQVVMRAVSDGTTRVVYHALSDGENIFQQTAEYEVTEDSKWLVRVALAFDGNRLSSVSVGDIEPLGDQAPEKIVTTDQAAAAAVSVRSIEGFEEPIELKVRSTSGGMVSVPGEGDFVYEKGASVSLVAMPREGYVFMGWDNNVANPALPNTTIVLNEDQVVTARFTKGDIHVVTILSTEGGSVVGPGQGVYMLKWGAVIDLVAQPREGWEFVKWTGPVADPTSQRTSLTVRHAEEIMAEFVRTR